ncbi:proline-rich nuclear receptor coactivator 1-like [Arapaima gigas]
MYPPSPPSCDLQNMLGETLGCHVESNLDNIENTKRSNRTSHHVGAALNKRQTLHKKGAKRARASPDGLQNRHPRAQEQHEQLQQHRHARLVDVNNNHGGGSVVLAHGPTNHERVNNHSRQTTVLTFHHLKQGGKKEFLKSKSGRPEKGPQPNGQSVHNFSKHEHLGQNLNSRNQRNRHSPISGGVSSVRRNDSSCLPNSSSSPLRLCLEGRKLLNLADNVKIVNLYLAEPLSEESLKDGEKVYAGAKFSEPPSPSVLPKPPSHWVGEKTPQHSDNSKEQMTVHLKSLLKVQVKP